ncbi:MAG: ATP-binding protein [Desulfobacula sp.]|nr:ATP-binding protein [Desulfobacula sp.]
MNKQPIGRYWKEYSQTLAPHFDVSSQLKKFLKVSLKPPIQLFQKTVYREAHVFFEDMFEAEQTGKTKKVLKLFSEADLLIIDDLFLRKKMPSDAADYLLDIIINRYSKRKSVVITSNRPIEDWGILLKDNAASSAILDRLLHHGHLLKFEGKSYRLKEAAKRLSQMKDKK